MDSRHIQLLINNKKEELEDLQRLLADLQLKEAELLTKETEEEPSSSTEPERRAETYPPGRTVYFSKETRGRRRHYNQEGTIEKRDKRFLHIRDAKGKIVRRTPKYTRFSAVIE